MILENSVRSELGNQVPDILWKDNGGRGTKQGQNWHKDVDVKEGE